MPFNMNNINTQMNSTLDTLGAEISSKTAASQGEMTEIQLLDLQRSMQKWSIMVNMHTNMQKTWSDTLKSIVQNLR